jgi:hypothetical protein
MAQIEALAFNVNLDIKIPRYSAHGSRRQRRGVDQTALVVIPTAGSDSSAKVGLHQVVMESGSLGYLLPYRTYVSGFAARLRGQCIVRKLPAAAALLVLLGYSRLIVWSVPRVVLAVNANPISGSVWIWLGPTIGTDWTLLPPVALQLT